MRLVLFLASCVVSSGTQSARAGLCLRFVVSGNSEPAQATFPDTQQSAQQEQPAAPSAPEHAAPSASSPAAQNRVQPGPNLQQNPPLPGQQPKRILGLMPNFRAVSAGATPPPPTPKQNLIIATQNSFDYSAFVFVGITSLLAEATNTHPQLGKGVGGFGDTTGAATWIRPTATTGLSFCCLLSFIKTNAIMPWARAALGSVSPIQRRASSSRRAITDIRVSMPRKYSAEALLKPFR